MKFRIKEYLLTKNLLLPITALIILSIIVLINVNDFSIFKLNYFLPLLQQPWLYASGELIIDAIDQFNGDEFNTLRYFLFSSLVIINVIFYFIIIPSIILNFFRKKDINDFNIKSDLIHMASFIFLFLFSMNILFGIISINNDWKQREDVYANEIRDKLSYDLKSFSFNFLEKAVIINKKNDIEKYKYLLERDFDLYDINGTNYYTIKSEDQKENYFLKLNSADKSVIIYAINNHTGYDKNFNNINGSIGKMQLKLNISLKNTYLFEDNEN